MPKYSLYPEQQLRRRVMKWAMVLEVNPTQVLVRPMADRWGSCAPDGTVTLADDLATAESEVQDYVIVHELLHLRHQDHGRVFRALLARHVPAWTSIEEKLSGSRSAARRRSSHGRE